MQLARNLWPEDISGRDKTLRRKLREAHVAREIEAKYTKDKILELYLNQIDLGNRAYGVEAASQRYFGKSVRDLNVAEAATLAAIPKAPSRYNPAQEPQPERPAPQHHPEPAAGQRAALRRRHRAVEGVPAAALLALRLQRRRRVLRRVRPAAARCALRLRPLQARATGSTPRSTSTPSRPPSGRSRRGSRPSRAGPTASSAWPTYRQYLDARADTPDNGSRTTTPYLQGLVVTLDAKTGNIRAMVGGRDFEDSKFNRATQALRQPGSTFKPIVYAAAVEAGYPLSHVMVDDPLTVEIATDTTPWAPQNYDLEFDGPMTLRRALYMSRNIIAIKLGMEMGEDAVISEATKFGLTTRVPPYPSIHIGSADVIPLEMIAAYTTFANLGTRTIPNAILRVEDRTGKIVGSRRSARFGDGHRARVADDRALRDVVRHGTAVGSAAGSSAGHAGPPATPCSTGKEVRVWSPARRRRAHATSSSRRRRKYPHPSFTG